MVCCSEDSGPGNVPITYRPRNQGSLNHIPYRPQPPQPEHQNEEPNGMRAIVEQQALHHPQQSSASGSAATSSEIDNNNTNRSLESHKKVRNNKKKRRKNKNGLPCRCRKRKHLQVKSPEFLCVPCNKICRNVNKSPLKCEKVNY